jgi:hypothetical protein
MNIAALRRLISSLAAAGPAVLAVSLASGLHAQTLFVPGGSLGSTSNGNVGIGTATPVTKLNVQADNAGLWNEGQLLINGSTNNYKRLSLGFDTSSNFGFIQSLIAGDNSYNLVLEPYGGNVGVGTTAPNQKLSVAGNLSIGTTGSVIMMGQDAYTGGGGFLALRSSGSYGKDFSVENYSQANGWKTNLFVAGESGSVGVGTATPGGKLQILAPDIGSLKTYSTSNGFGLILDQYYSAASESGASFTRTADIVASTGDISSSQIRFLTKPANSNPNVAMVIAGNGNVGIGTSSPEVKAEIATNSAYSLYLSGFAPSLYFGPASGVFPNGSGNASAGFIGFSTAGGAYAQGPGDLNIATQSRSAANSSAINFLVPADDEGVYRLAMKINREGNVGIGTSSPGTNKLAVNGTVRAKEVVVETTGWSDYVFAKDYDLKPLSEVERQINQEGHLPGIPSAAEVSEKGIGLGEMQARLLAKIEELTLHQIALEKRVNAQAVELDALKKENAALRRQ